MTIESGPNGHPAESEQSPLGPLAGVRVVDFTALLQGPLATQILGDFGADVVKMEKHEGEWMRHWGVFMSRSHGETDAFLAFNRNKRSVSVDLRDSEVRERILAVIDDADVVVENFRPGVMDRLGLGYEDLKVRNPRIIYAASSGFGVDGPYVKRPGQDMLVQSLTGALWLTGRRDDPPMPMGVAIADQFAGLHLAIGILGALHARFQTGQGQRVDVDLMSCMMAAQQQELTAWLNNRVSLDRPERTVGHAGITGPAGVYATSDGFITLAMSSCPQLGDILGVPWLRDYETNELMLEGRDEIHRKLSDHFGHQTSDHWLGLLSSHDVWCAPVQDYAALEHDPQVLHRGLWWTVPYGDGSSDYRTVGSPFTYSATPVSLRRSAPSAGQHTLEFIEGRLWDDQEGSTDS